jgi:hypothetical protein
VHVKVGVYRASAWALVAPIATKSMVRMIHKDLHIFQIPLDVPRVMIDGYTAGRPVFVGTFVTNLACCNETTWTALPANNCTMWASYLPS